MANARATEEQQRTALLTLQDAAKEVGPPYTSLRDLVIAGHFTACAVGGQPPHLGEAGGP